MELDVCVRPYIRPVDRPTLPLPPAIATVQFPPPPRVPRYPPQMKSLLVFRRMSLYTGENSLAVAKRKIIYLPDTNGGKNWSGIEDQNSIMKIRFFLSDPILTRNQ